MTSPIPRSKTSALDFKLRHPLPASTEGEVENFARRGTLTISGRPSLETPNFYTTTSRGVIPHLTPDILASQASIVGSYIAIEDFIERRAKATPPILLCPPGTAQSRLRTFTCLPSSITTILSPRRIPAVPAPVGNSDQTMSVFTSVGFMDMNALEYAHYISMLAPDIAISMADLPFTYPLSAKRISKMADRTQRWLTTLLTKREEDENLNSPSTSSVITNATALFAPILPIPYADQSDYIEYVAYETLGVGSIEGLAFHDTELIPEMPQTTALQNLPRLSLQASSSPQDILQQISLGIDIITVSFVNFATDAGLALTFSLPQQKEVETEGSFKPLAIDLFDTKYAKVTNALVEGCTCYTCTTHHCAFIQHLLAAKEMLGWVLLQIHNHEVLRSFFATIRASIDSASFVQRKRAFERRYESALPKATGQAPRSRGYHFKSEGPGEPKRNKAAWGQLGNGVGTDKSEMAVDI